MEERNRELDEFMELINNVDMTKFDLLDQMRIGMAYATFMNTVKPIMAKYAMKDPNVTNFIMKL